MSRNVGDVGEIGAAEIEAGAAWWAEKLRTPPVMDNGDAFQSVMLTRMAKHAEPLTDEQIAAFQRALVVALTAKAANGERRLKIYCDYGADRLLADACAVAGINPYFRFPVKTAMYFEPGRVEVSEGYGEMLVALALFEADADGAKKAAQHG